MMEPVPPPGSRAAIFGAWRRGLLVAGGAVAVLAVFLVAGGRRSREPGVERESAPAVVTVAQTSLRREPGARAEAALALKRGDEVEILADRGVWLEVRASGVRGFVRGGEVERESQRKAREQRAKKILSFSPVFGVVGQETAVLLAPYPLAPRAGALPKGTVIPIHAVDHAYFAYRDAANGVAFVASADVDLVPRDPKSPDIVPDRSLSLRRLAALDVPTPVPTPFDFSVTPPVPPLAGVPDRPPGEPPAAPEGSTVEPAVLVSKVDPAYPEVAVRAQVEGSVVLEIEIDDTGRVTDARVTRGLPFGLSQSAEEAVRQWRYRPARGPGGPIPSRKTVRILFTLRGGG